MSAQIMNIATEQGFQDALAWTQYQLSLLEDGGVWIIPRSMSAVRIISHSNLEAEFTGMRRETGVVTMMRALGWKIIDMDTRLRK